jgi:hypothetical protein
MSQLFDEQQGFAQDFVLESDEFSARIAALTSQTGFREQSLFLIAHTRHELCQYLLAERDLKHASLKSVSEENDKLRTQLADTSAKPAAEAEVAALRARVAELEAKLKAAVNEHGKLKTQVPEPTRLARSAASD